jgi:hypothetical protein
LQLSVTGTHADQVGSRTQPFAVQVSLPQLTHAWPPVPHAVWLVPELQVLPEQHPPHDDASHTHAPLAQRWPAPHVPLVHVPPHSSDAPHAFPAQEGTHGVGPHRFGPRPPQVWLPGQLPQSITSPQRPVSLPQRPAQSAGSFGVQVAPLSVLALPSAPVPPPPSTPAPPSSAPVGAARSAPPPSAEIPSLGKST